MGIILENQEGEQERAVGYNCIYRYRIHRVKLEYNITNGIWEIIPRESYGEEEQILDSVLDDIRSLLQALPLDQQIQIIIKRYDKYFDEIDQERNNQPSTSLTIPEDDEQLQKSTNHLEKDVVDYGFHSFITGSRSKFSGLAPPPVAPRRSRQNSACSTQSSVRYASFTPTAPVRRRRVIESIHLHVQRKKKTFEKIVDVLKRTEPPTMDQLGLEFLRVYDGKFNYPEGHRFVMPFRKKTWFLTIEQIKCVDCPVGDIGPRSVLILTYKGRCTSVHV